MVTKREKVLLDYIIKHCSNIEEDVAGMTQEEFFSDRKTQNSVCFDVLQIGEIVKSLPRSLTDKYEEIPWKQIKGMRDWVVHGYETLKMPKVWNTVIKDIKPLRECCESIIELEWIEEGEQEDISSMPKFDPNKK